MKETLIERMRHAAAHCEKTYDLIDEADALLDGVAEIERLRDALERVINRAYQRLSAEVSDDVCHIALEALMEKKIDSVYHLSTEEQAVLRKALMRSAKVVDGTVKAVKKPMRIDSSSSWCSPEEVRKMLDEERLWLADELSAAIEEAKQSGFLFTVEACVGFLRGKLISGTKSVFNRNSRRAEGGQ